MPANVKVTPNALARTLSRDLKRTITPKGVRTTARAVLARFDKARHPEYQSHEYTAAEAKTLRAAFVGRSQRARVQPKRAAAPKRKVTRKVTPPTADAS